MKTRIGILKRAGLCAALALGLAVGGCKKDAAPGAPAKAEGEAAKGSASADGATKKGATGESAAKTGAPGATPGAEPTEGGSPKDAPAGSTRKTGTAPVVVPADVVAYAGVRGLDDFVTQATTVVNQVKPVPGLGMVFSAGLAKSLGFSATDWIDGARPIRVAVANPKDSPKPAVIALPMKSREAVEGALPAEREAGADGAAFKYKAGANDAWVAFTADAVVFARDPKVLARLQPFVAGPLASWAPTDAFELHVSVANLTTMFAPEVAKARARITEKIVGRATDSPFPEAAEWLQKAIAWSFDTIGDLDTATLGVRIDGARVLLPLTVRAKSGSGLQAALAGGGGRPVTLLDYAPASSWFAVGASVDPTSGVSWTEIGVTLLAEGMKLSDADKARLLELVKTSAGLQTGETAVALSREGSMSLAVLYVGGTKDGAKQREAMLGAWDLLWTKGVERAAAEKGAPPPGIDLSSLSKAIETVGAELAPLGITLTAGSEARPGGQVDSLTARIDFAKFPPALEDPQQAELMKSLFGDTMSLALGFGKERYAVALGPEAAARVREVIDGKKAAAPALRAVMANAVPSASFVTYLSFTDAARAFVSVPELQGKRDVIAAMAPTGGSALSIGSVSGGGLQVTLDVSLPDLQQMTRLQ